MKKWTFLLVVTIWATGMTAQNVGINTPNPTEMLHLRTDSTKLALRLDSKKSGESGFNYDATIGTPTTVQNFVLDTQYIDWTDLDFTKIVTSDNSRLNSPQLEIYPEIANPVRIQFSVNPSIPSNATITNITLNAEWRRFGTFAGELRIGSIYLKKASNGLLLLSFGFEKITSSTDQSVAIPYQQVHNPVTPDMLNLGDVYISLVNLHSVSPGLSRLEIDRLWLEVEYSVPADGSENEYWTAGVKEGTFKISHSPNLNSGLFLSIDEIGTTQLKELKITKNAGPGKVLTSNDEGRASWSNLPSTNVNSLNDLIDASANSKNIFIGQSAGDSTTTGQYNTGAGLFALQDNTSGASNTAIGYLSLSSNLTGSNNTAIGTTALDQNTVGQHNTAIGTASLGDNIGGIHNTGTGSYTLGNNSSGNYNTGLGSYALSENINGQSNTATGSDALLANISGSQNSAFGRNALKLNDSGNYNTGIGYAALLNNTSGNNNLAIGRDALLNNVANSRSTAIGYRSMIYANNSNVENMTYNTAIGYEALLGHYSITINTGIHNTAIGDHALYLNSSGSNNTSVGSSNLSTNTIGYDNVSIGNKALQLNTEGFRNTAIGSESMYSNTTGSRNTAIGKLALFFNKGNIGSTAIGFEAMFNADNRINNPITTSNTAVGYQALYGSVNPGVNTGTANTALGAGTLRNNSYGSFNTAIGTNALLSNEENSRSTAVGYYAMKNAGNTNTGYDTYNTAIGYSALEGSGTVSANLGTYNTAVGDVAMNQNTSGSSNTALGAESLFNNTTGHDNTSIGRRAMYNNTTGTNNTIIGNFALFENTSGDFNVALGNDALLNNTTGNFNLALGSNALFDNTTGGANVAVGSFAMEESTTSAENTAVGKGAMQFNTTGSENTAIGFLTGPTSTSNVINQCTFLGTKSSLSTSRTNVTMVGFGLNGTFCTGNNQLLLGNAAITQIRAQVSSITTYSDARIKLNIADDVKGLDFINRLRPVTYNQDPILLHRILGTPDSLVNQVDHSQIQCTKFIGFLAQEVDAAAKASGFDFPGIDKPEHDNEVYSLRYVDFIMPMTKAIQELSEENTALSEKYKSLLLKMEALEAKMEQMVSISSGSSFNN